MNRKVYSVLSARLTARANCEKSNNQEWFAKHTDFILDLVKETMPNGSGIDCGTKLDLYRSNPDKLVFNFSYHHMNESGMYDGWTDHSAIVTPDLAFGFRLKITGRNRNQIKEYLHETYDDALEQEIEIK